MRMPYRARNCRIRQDRYSPPPNKRSFVIVSWAFPYTAYLPESFLTYIHLESGLLFWDHL